MKCKYCGRKLNWIIYNLPPRKVCIYCISALDKIALEDEQEKERFLFKRNESLYKKSYNLITKKGGK